MSVGKSSTEYYCMGTESIATLSGEVVLGDEMLACLGFPRLCEVG